MGPGMCPFTIAWFMNTLDRFWERSPRNGRHGSIESRSEPERKREYVITTEPYASIASERRLILFERLLMDDAAPSMVTVPER